MIVYVPKILRSLTEICEVMGVGPKTVQHWAQHGAPIAVAGSGRRCRYSAETARLQFWREQHEKDTLIIENSENLEIAENLSIPPVIAP